MKARKYKAGELTLHDVINLKLGSSMKADFAVSADIGKGFCFMSGKTNGDGVICTKQEYNNYIAAIERDYKSHKAEFEQKPVFTQAMKDAGELPPVGSEVACEGVTYTVIINKPDCDNRIVIMSNNGSYGAYDAELFTPVKSPEEKLIDELTDIVSGFGVLAIPRKHLVNALIEKYNITPK